MLRVRNTKTRKPLFFGRALEARGFAENRGVRCWSEVLGVRWRRRVGATGRSAALAMDLRRGERVFRRGRSQMLINVPVSPESFPARERGGGDRRGAAVGSRALGSRARDFRPVEVIGCGVGFGRWGWLVSWRRSSSHTHAASPKKRLSRRLSTRGRVLWAHTPRDASGTARRARLESGWVCATWGSSRGVSGVDRRRQT